MQGVSTAASAAPAAPGARLTLYTPVVCGERPDKKLFRDGEQCENWQNACEKVNELFAKPSSRGVSTSVWLYDVPTPNSGLRSSTTTTTTFCTPFGRCGFGGGGAGGGGAGPGAGWWPRTMDDAPPEQATVSLAFGTVPFR